jgi:hypothetical protein
MNTSAVEWLEQCLARGWQMEFKPEKDLRNGIYLTLQYEDRYGTTYSMQAFGFGLDEVVQNARQKLGAGADFLVATRGE